MRLKEVSLDEIKGNPIRSKQDLVRELLDKFKESDMKYAEVEEWEEISDTIEGCRTMIRNQISYRNGNKYAGLGVTIRTDFSSWRVFLIKKEGENDEGFEMA